MILGRKNELSVLQNSYSSKQSQIIAIYGRRRIGKSFLIDAFCKNKKFLKFEGLESEQGPQQIKNFLTDLGRQTNDPLLSKIKSADWIDVLEKLTTIISLPRKEKIIIFIDELQWMASQKTTLISLLKKYWDNHWKDLNVQLILCGSISSYMVKKVIKSKALYGRINHEMNITELAFSDTVLFLPKQTTAEIFKYQLVLGGVPKYWVELNKKHSFEQNINHLFFKSTGVLFNDFEKIFYSQFREHKQYEKIIKALQLKAQSTEELSRKLNFTSGGGFKYYLDNLELAGFIKSYTPFDKTLSSKLKKYRITDDYIRFYFKYVDPYKKQIQNHKSDSNFFLQHVKSSWQKWVGFAFENYCLKNAMLIAEKLGFADHVINFGPIFQRQSVDTESGFQIDLAYLRNDNTITICEIKNLNSPVSTSVIRDFNSKLKGLHFPAKYNVQKALITVSGADLSLIESDYFDHILTLDDLAN
jgi:AAA+ ATPase superfamily predicted ATPase